MRRVREHMARALCQRAVGSHAQHGSGRVTLQSPCRGRRHVGRQVELVGRPHHHHVEVLAERRQRIGRQGVGVATNVCTPIGATGWWAQDHGVGHQRVGGQPLQHRAHHLVRHHVVGEHAGLQQVHHQRREVEARERVRQGAISAATQPGLEYHQRIGNSRCGHQRFVERLQLQLHEHVGQHAGVVPRRRRFISPSASPSASARIRRRY